MAGLVPGRFIFILLLAANPCRLITIVPEQFAKTGFVFCNKADQNRIYFKYGGKGNFTFTKNFPTPMFSLIQDRKILGDASPAKLLKVHAEMADADSAKL